MRPYLTCLLALAAVFFTACDDGLTWHDYDPDSEISDSENDADGQSDDESDDEDGLPDGPESDDDDATDESDDEDDLPDGPESDDDDATNDEEDPPSDDDDATDDEPSSDSFEGNDPGECDNGADEDLDGLFDCDDPDCFGAPVCQTSTPSTESICDDGVDEDLDGDTDCDDSDCASDPACIIAPDALEGNDPGECDNGADEDLDGLFDCDDPDCASELVCIDDDADGATADIDCDDTDPAIFPGAIELCDEIDSNCDGLGDEIDNDGDGWLACESEECDDDDINAYQGAPEICGNGIDESCDGTPDGGCPPAWCPSGTVTDLIVNTGFENAEAMELFPSLGQHWGYGELLLSTPPERSCAGIAYNGGCSLKVTGQAASTIYGGAPWENQVRYLVDLSSAGVSVNDPIHVEASVYGDTGTYFVGIELIENAAFTPVTTIVGAISTQAPMGSWNSVSLDGTVTSTSGTMRLELQYGQLSAGEIVYVDDFSVQACVP